MFDLASNHRSEECKHDIMLELYPCQPKASSHQLQRLWKSIGESFVSSDQTPESCSSGSY